MTHAAVMHVAVIHEAVMHEAVMHVEDRNNIYNRFLLIAVKKCHINYV